jgi:hypothetical protein
METFEPPKYLASLIAAINDGAKAAQTGAFAFALVGLYLLATAFSASDEDLLLDRTLAIAQLSAQIPVTVSFAMMPILFVALHVFTLIRYDMLAANVRQFRVDLEAMVPFPWDRERCRQLLANVEFIQSLTAPPGSPLRSRLYGFVAWVVIAGFPVLVLLAVQTNALRYQSVIVADVQRLSLLIDLAVLFWFYERQIRQGAFPVPGAFVTVMRRWGMYPLAAVVVLVNLAWLNVLGSTVGNFIGPYSLAFGDPLGDLLCPEFNWGCRFLRVDHRTLVGNVWDKKALVELGSGQPLTGERRASFEGLYLRERTLRSANLSESRFYAADLRGADLTDANLTDANLTGAHLASAHLPGANLHGAHLGGADLTGANLEGAHLDRAQLTGADLIGAHLTGADLRSAQLTGAPLIGADLTGADLRGAQLTGAYLIGAHLTGADLRGAQLTGTYLSGVDLADARNLTQTQLEEACGKPNALPQGLTLDRSCPAQKSTPPPLGP